MDGGESQQLGWWKTALWSMEVVAASTVFGFLLVPIMDWPLFLIAAGILPVLIVVAFVGLVRGGKKRPWLAALLNAVPLGFGYLYLGRLDKVPGAQFAGIGTGLFGWFIMLSIGFVLFFRLCGDTCPPVPNQDLKLLMIRVSGAVPLLLTGIFSAWHGLTTKPLDVTTAARGDIEMR